MTKESERKSEGRIAVNDYRVIDYSLEIPELICKLETLMTFMFDVGFRDEPLDSGAAKGVGLFIQEIVGILKIINDEFYGDPDGHLPLAPIYAKEGVK